MTTISADVPSASEPHPDPRVSVTFYLPNSVRGRLRAAFRATRAHEADESWSHFIEKALLSELMLREWRHNQGERFDEDDKPITPGRPVSLGRRGLVTR